MIRFLDIVFSFLGIVILSPFFIIISLCILADSKGGIFYKQQRVGKNNMNFNVYKFRSMAKDSDKKGLLTVGSRDSRITPIGYFLRKYKLDELPQLFNVLIGDMSLVGPRPEVRKYVDTYTPAQRQVLCVRPGITDYASIEYVDENTILGASSNPDQTYIEQIIPDKIRYNLKYIQNRSVKEYFKILFLTIIRIFS